MSATSERAKCRAIASGVPDSLMHNVSYGALGGGTLGGGVLALLGHQGPPKRLPRKGGRPMGPSTLHCQSSECQIILLLSCGSRFFAGSVSVIVFGIFALLALQASA